MIPVFTIPILVGISLLVGSFGLFRRERLDPRHFAIAVILSGLLVVSPGIYLVLRAVKSLFGIRFTFVLAFGLAILLLVALIIYLILVIGRLRDEMDSLWQEVALFRQELAELDEKRGQVAENTDDD